MKSKLEILKEYTQKQGVLISLIITFFSAILLIISLISREMKYRELDSIGTISLIAEFIYGAILSFLILRKREKYLHLVPFLFLNWFIGCFCVNTIFPIFEDLPIWVYIITSFFCVSNFFIYQKREENYTTLCFFFINGLSYTLILYYMLYLLPITLLSLIGIIVLGLGFYGLVPAIVSIFHIVTIGRLFQDNKKYLVSFSAGFLIVVVALIAFAIRLNVESEKIAKREIIQSFENTEDFPNYIKISQNLEPNFFNEILLKKDLVYKGPEDFFTFRNFNSFGSNQFNERKVHNPFITIAYMFCKDLNLSSDDKINILKSNFDKRLETEEQLWSGEDLFTRNIKEDVKLYPDSRLAYTEITMKIASEKSRQNQEAIYSFQLPEGSVATSLSLWVNGVERKGVLTTKEKAKKAYKQIVGVEYRDPSLMQWKEGNKVVVRVFPINYETPRLFKCGFTTPLKVEDTKMTYESLSIKGPNINNAATISRIQIVGDTKVETSKDFEFKDNFYTNKSKGLDKWEASMDLNKKPVSDSFVWKDKVYEVKDIQKSVIAFTPSEIILDLNSNWTSQEIESFVSLRKKQFYVYTDKEKKAITIENYKEIQSQFEDLHYSLLPLYKITKNSLIITKSGTFSANFEELETSDYLKKIKSGTQQQNLKVINISSEINPFWQTVKEQKYVDFFQTTIKHTLELISKKQFILFKTAENAVNIEPANISIQENSKNESSKSNGSNHIYRMYAFGKVLEEQVKIQNGYLSHNKYEPVSQDTASVTAISVDEFRKENIKIQNDSLVYNKYVNLAKDANIVTPISSLIVLETDEDYKKNGIEKNVDTLGNASINNDGSVPEPHEWLLIIIGITTLFFYYRKTKKQTT